MNPPPVPATSDPVIHSVAICSGKSGRHCGAPMSPIRIYEGKGSRPEMRGAICQSCSSCFWTIFHTPAYNYEDSQRLLNRLRYPGHASGYPANLRPPETHARAPPTQPTASTLQSAATQPVTVLTQGNKILCSNPECRTLGGNRTQGSKTCIEYKCKSCCKKAALDAAQHSQARRPCHAHSQPEIHTVAQQPPAPIIPTLADPIQPQPVAPVPQPIAETVVPLSQPEIQDPLQTIPAPLALTNQRRPLGQPLGGTWSTGNDVVTQKTQTLRNLKMQQHNIEERKKRTIVLIIYHLNGKPPLRLDQHVDTFPHFRLSGCDELVKDLGLGENTRLDAWTGSEWITINIHGIITVEKGQRIVLKIRPSLRNGLDECPGLEEELKKAAKRGLRRAAVEFVSPVKDAPRNSDMASTQNTGTVSTPFPASIVLPTNPQLNHCSLTPPASILGANLEPTSTHATVLPASALTHLNLPLSTHPNQPLPEVKLKRWPFDFYVYEVHNGMCQIRDTLSGSISQDQHRKHQSKKFKGKRAKRRRHTTVEKAFHAAFPNAKWVRSTYYDHKTIWYRQDSAIRELFIDLGESEQATYPRFLDAIDHPSRLPSPVALHPENSQPKKTSCQKKRRRSPSTSSSNDSSSESDSSESPSPKVKSIRKPLKKRCRSAERDSSSTNSDSNDGDFHGSDGAFNAPTSLINLTTVDDNIDPSLRFLPASPSSADLDKLGKRVADLQELLDEIVMDPEESEFFQSSRGTFTAGSSLHKDQSNFCQWNSTYYSTQGKHIIASRLRQLFPEISFEKDVYHPLSWSAFIDEFLLPETLLLLIEEDRHISRDDAFDILRGSGTQSTLPKTPVKQEPTELSLRVVNPSRNPPEVIDLTDSPPAVKQEPVDTETISSCKGKGKEIIIDLTIESDED